MGRIKISILGIKFGHLEVIGETNQKRGTNYLRRCRCICGKVILRSGDRLKRICKHQSCGCYYMNKNLTDEERKDKNKRYHKWYIINGKQYNAIRRQRYLLNKSKNG